MRRILFVDDEINILKSLKRAFVDSDYHIFIAESGTEALSILKEQEIDLIVSDMRMPNMDGYELLNKVKAIYPQILRMILSGYVDKDRMVNVVQQNIANQYLSKPWENAILIKLIDDTFKLKIDVHC